MGGDVAVPGGASVIFGGMTLAGGTGLFSGQMDWGPSPSGSAFLSSSDPVGTFLNGTVYVGFGTTSLTGDFGALVIDPRGRAESGKGARTGRLRALYGGRA